MRPPSARPVRRALVLAAALPLAVVAAEEDWTLELTPYLLLPRVEATLDADAPGGGPEAGASSTDWLELINAVAMLKAEARRERVFVAFDWMYLDMGDVDSVVRSVGFPDGTVPVGATATLDSDASFDGWTVMMSAGYRVAPGGRGDLDLYGGLRTLNLTSSLRWELTATVTSPGGSHSFPAAGRLEADDETWDAVAGMRAAWRFDQGWRAFAFGDLGRGDGSESAQWSLGVGWTGDGYGVELSWRDIAWHGLYSTGRGELRLTGAVIGATFRL